MRKLVSLALLLFLLSAVPSHADVIAPDQTVAGKTMAEWSAEWWKWALSAPAGSNPLTDATGDLASVGNSGPVFFLAGTTGGSVTRSFEIPDSTYVFFPLLNAVDFEGDGGFTLAEIVGFLDAAMDSASVFATIDGVPVADPSSFRQATTFSFDVPPGNLFGFPSGNLQLASDGYWVMLSPLAQGAHTISFGGSLDNFSVSVTDNVTAVPEPATTLLVLGGMGMLARRRRRTS